MDFLLEVHEGLLDMSTGWHMWWAAFWIDHPILLWAAVLAPIAIIIWKVRR